MENHTKLIALIVQAIHYLIENNATAVTTHLKMQMRKTKVSIVKTDYALIFSNPVKNIFIRIVQKTHVESYPYKQDEYNKDAFAALDKDRQLVKSDYNYHFAFLKGDVVISYGNADKKPNPFEKAFSLDKGFQRALDITLKKDNGFIRRETPGSRDGANYTISLASERELKKLHELINTLMWHI